MASMVGFTVAALAILWWSAAIVVSLWVKQVLSKVNGQPPIFPYSFFFTAVLNMFVALFSYAGSTVYRSFTGLGNALPAIRRREVGFLIFMGLLQGLELALANKSYQYLSVSGNRLIMACTVVFQLFTAIIWGLEEIGLLKWIAAAVLVLGGVTESLGCAQTSSPYLNVICGPQHREVQSGGVSDTWQGWVLVVSSVLVSANRWALTQYIFQRSDANSAFRTWTKPQMLPYMTIGTTSMCFVLAGIFEPAAFSQVTEVGSALLVPCIVISIFIMILTLSELLIVSLTAATVMVILAVLHNIPVILAGILIYHEEVYRNQWIGFTLCTCGAVMYFYARNLEKDTPDSTVDTTRLLGGSVDDE